MPADKPRLTTAPSVKRWRVYYTVDTFLPTELGTLEATDAKAAQLVASSRWPGLDPYLIQPIGKKPKRNR